jgi:hypothetical protein
MPSSPRRAQSDETYRDARQIGQVGRFFGGQRPAGVVAFSPLRWTSLLGRPGALAWLLCSRAAIASGRPSVAENVLAALLASPFEREPARYRLYETGAPPIALPTVPSGYVQATARLGVALQNLRVRDGIDAFRRVMRELARSAGDDAEAAVDFVYAHTELG